MPPISPQFTSELPSCPLGIPKVKAKDFSLSGPDATTVAVAELPGTNVCAVAVIEPNPAGEPSAPVFP